MNDPLADVIAEAMRADHPCLPGDRVLVAVRAHLAAVLDAERQAWEAIRDTEDASIPGPLASDTIVRHNAVGALDALDCIRDALVTGEPAPQDAEKP